MDCLQSRRLLLAAPREQSREHRAHIHVCPRCEGLAQGLLDLDRLLESVALAPIPEGLTHRVLPRALRVRRPRSLWKYAAVALVAIASTVAALFASEVIDSPVFAVTAHAVGPTHPAIVAISEVVEEDRLPALPPVEGAEVQEGLKGLGLAFDAGYASARYVGKCHIEGSSDCDHIIVSSPDVHANVMLVRDYPIKGRVLVEDRRVVALMGPAGRGGYIVVAQSTKAAKRVEKLLLVRG
jgi:hypothetical protein